MTENFRKFNQHASQLSALELGISYPTSETPLPTSHGEKHSSFIVGYDLPDLSSEIKTASAPATPSPPPDLNRRENVRQTSNHLDTDAFFQTAARDESVLPSKMSTTNGGSVKDKATIKVTSPFKIKELPPSSHDSIKAAATSKLIPIRTDKNVLPKNNNGKNVDGPNELPCIALGRMTIVNFNDKNPLLIQRLIKKQTNMGNQLIIFSDVDAPQRCASICVQTALEIARETQKRVLIVDSDTESKIFSRNVEAAICKGLTDIVRGEIGFSDALMKTEFPSVFVLAAGQKPLDFRFGNQTTQDAGERLIGEIRQQFDYICVTTGTAFDSSLLLWAQCCDSTFVTLDPSETSRSLAKAAVRELQKAGARIEGCITSFANTET